MAFEVGRLWFWRVKPKSKANPEALCTSLARGKVPAALEEIPVADILKALKKEYPSIGLSRKRCVGEVDIEEEEMAFELVWSKRYFQFTFYGNAYKHMDRVVDLMTKLSLPCYDASDQKAHTLSNPPRFALTPEQEAIESEVESLLDTEVAKIKASTPDRSQQAKQWLGFLKSGGADRAYEEAIRRIEVRKPR